MFTYYMTLAKDFYNLELPQILKTTSVKCRSCRQISSLSSHLCCSFPACNVMTVHMYSGLRSGYTKILVLSKELIM